MKRKPPTCKDCKHYREETVGRLVDISHCVKGGYLDLVSGKTLYHGCSAMRCSSLPCGPEGKLFEPKAAS